MLEPILRGLIGIERPILEAQGLTMWGYAVLLSLGDEPVRTQAALAEMIGADKTRIIGDLDELEQRGLIGRERDPDDRRVRLVSITSQGRRTRDRVRTAIRRHEEQLLDEFSAGDRAAFVRVARRLAKRARAGEL